VKRPGLLAFIVVCLCARLLLGQSDSPSIDPLGSGLVNAADAAVIGPGVWGRVNPDFWGYPTVSFASDLVVLSRAAPHPQTILYDGTFNPLLDASELGSTSAAGGRFNLTFFGVSGWDIMFDGLFMDDFNTQRRVNPSNGVNLIFYQGLAVAPIDTASYRSRLDTGEFNVRRRLNPQLALLAGIRELQLSENLDFTQASANSAYTSQTGNRLFGFQLGAEAVLPARGYGRFFASGKYGIYNNRFRVGAQATSGGSPIHVQVQDDMASCVGDFNAGFEVQTVPRMTLRFGYQCLWLNSVALSVDQLNQYSIFTNDGSVAKANPVYHGGFVGLVFVF
jgi:hypothetical protein